MRLFGFLCLLACSPPLGHAPIARMDLTPAYVPKGDNFATAVLLDGSQSCDELDEPEACVSGDAGAAPSGLRFSWSIGSPDARLEGAPSDATLTIRVRGERPVAISLTVTDSEDTSSTIEKSLGLIIAP